MAAVERTASSVTDKKMDFPAFKAWWDENIQPAAQSDTSAGTRVQSARQTVTAVRPSKIEPASEYDAVLEKYFRRYDLDGSGVIETADEFTQLCTHLMYTTQNGETKWKVELQDGMVLVDQRAQSIEQEPMDFQAFRTWWRQHINDPDTTQIPTKKNGKSPAARRIAASIRAAAGQSSQTKSTISSETEDMLKKYFHRYDLNGSGKIESKDEFEQLCTHLMYSLKVSRENVLQDRMDIVERTGKTVSEKPMDFKLFREWWIKNACR
jgi:Ca2+-binding EF-hand superfamily protein